LRQTGYVKDGTLAAPATDSPMTKALSEHIKTLPQQLSTNQAALDSAIGSWNKTDFATGKPNPNYRPEAIAELTQFMPNFAGMIAYHGTPHTIKGQFDINKVGTGEGAQAYGHGMYFAENPNVAESYKTVAGKSEFVKFGDKVVPTASQEGQLLSDVTKLGRKAAINKYPDQADYIKTINPDNIKFEGGNLYKVDIPDADIPNMLDWDKSLSEMTKKEAAIIEPLKQKLIANKNPYHPESFETIGQVIQSSRGTNPNLEKQLLQAGIPGIKYLDEGSRSANKGTRNFVVFDPSTVKILEENAKPVSRKEIIEKQVKALKD